MAEIKDDAHSTFSHSATLYEDHEIQSDNPSEEARMEVELSRKQSLLAAEKKKPAAPTRTGPGTVQVTFGPGKRCVFISSLTGIRISYSGKCLFSEKYLDGSWAVGSYAISPHGDELAIHCGSHDKIPGWSWRAGGVANSPTYASLKTWLNEMLTTNTDNFTKTRLTFGSGASYYATCGDKYTWHDLPLKLLEAIQQYRKVLEKMRELKAARDSSPEKEIVIAELDVSSISGPLPLKAENFDLDNLPATWLPQCLALGMHDYFAATCRSAYMINLPASHKLYERITTSPQDVKKFLNMSLSVFNPFYYSLLLDDWSYRHIHDPGSLNLANCIKEHIQAYVKLEPGRSVSLETLPVGTSVASTERFDGNTNFKMKLNDGKDKEKEEKTVKEKKPGRLSRLFGKS